MHKGAMIAIVVVALLLSISACSSDVTEQNGTTSLQPTRSFSSELSREIWAEEGYEQGWLGNALVKKTNVPFSDMETWSYSWNIFDRFSHMSDPSLKGVSADNIQLVDGEHIAVIKKIKEEDYAEAGLAVIYRRKQENQSENWYRTRERYFFDPSRLYRLEDFSEIKIGDSSEKLCDIDPSIQYELLLPIFTISDETGDDNDRFYEVSLDDYEERNGVMILETDDETVAKYGAAVIRSINENTIFRILEDGMLEISYKRVDRSITEINFYPYGDEKMPERVTIRNADILDAVRRGE